MFSPSVYAISGSGGDYEVRYKRDWKGGSGSGGDYDVRDSGGFQPVGMFNNTDWKIRLGVLGFNPGPNNDRCDPGENASVDPLNCCLPDCTDQRIFLCFEECNPYCGDGVDAECDEDTPDTCGDGQGVCGWCLYVPCTDYACTDTCVGSRWSYADPVDNICITDSCTTDFCSWEYTCDETFASGCSGWMCDEDTDCGLSLGCSNICQCIGVEIKVGSEHFLEIEDELDKKDYGWWDKG